jgi:hypothetical protein
MACTTVSNFSSGLKILFFSSIYKNKNEIFLNQNCWKSNTKLNFARTYSLLTWLFDYFVYLSINSIY